MNVRGWTEKRASTICLLMDYDYIAKISNTQGRLRLRVGKTEICRTAIALSINLHHVKYTSASRKFQVWVKKSTG